MFGAWTNLVDMKAGNTLDSVIAEGGRTRVRHYLQDVGSTFGTGAEGPHQFHEGWESLYEGRSRVEAVHQPRLLSAAMADGVLRRAARNGAVRG